VGWTVLVGWLFRQYSWRTSATKASSLAKLLENETFFVDRSSGKYGLGQGLQNLGINIERHDDHFTQTTIDVEWISHCGEKQWIIVSSDKNIKKNILEKQAILSAKVAAFFFTSAAITSAQQIEAFSKALPKISNFVLNQKRPFIATISQDGSVELWLNHKGEDCIQQKIERRKQNKIRK
jgi:hypothetical protein